MKLQRTWMRSQRQRGGARRWWSLGLFGLVPVFLFASAWVQPAAPPAPVAAPAVAVAPEPAPLPVAAESPAAPVESIAAPAVPPPALAPALRVGAPTDVAVDPGTLTEVDRAVRSLLTDKHFPGATVLIARRGVVVYEKAFGQAVLGSARPDGGSTIPVQTDTVFDLASLSKLYTATAVMLLVDRGQVELDAPASRYLPQLKGDKAFITVRQLLTHSSGLPAGVPLKPVPNGRPDLSPIYNARLRTDPGETHTYSDAGYILLGELVRSVSGRPLEAFVGDELLRPLGLVDTTYVPPVSLRPRIAATQVQNWSLPGLNPRGLIWGQVHDGTAFVMGGVAGHAGFFGTAREVAAIGQLYLNRGEYDGRRLLRPETVAEMTRIQIANPAKDDYRGLGWELNQRWYMGDLASSAAFGHTGFTGTSLVVDPKRELVVVLLTNRLHPDDTKSNLSQARSRVATLASKAAK